MTCELVEKCPFFLGTMANMPATAEVYKRNYCFGDKSKCARYRVRQAKGPASVPMDLFPNHVERAQQIIAG